MKINFYLKLLLVCFVFCKSLLALEPIDKNSLNAIGDLIFMNETSRNKDLLVHWNKGEDFPSLGIGHFIWYKKNHRYRFNETFPALVEFYKLHNVPLPKILQENKYAPWISQEDLLQKKSSSEVQELIDFLYNTKDIQVLFMYKRLQDSIQLLPNNHVKQQFYRVANSSGGYYPLIDYVNFKGYGDTHNETYNNQGWGLIQVLEHMNGKEIGQEAINEFISSATFVLTRRANNSNNPQEFVWLDGWKKRLLTYSK